MSHDDDWLKIPERNFRDFVLPVVKRFVVLVVAHPNPTYSWKGNEIFVATLQNEEDLKITVTVLGNGGD